MGIKQKIAILDSQILNKAMSNYKPASLFIDSDVNQFRSVAKSFAQDAIFLLEETKNCTPTFHLLSSIALELLPKVLVAIDFCTKHKNDKNIVKCGLVIEEYECIREVYIEEVSREMSKFNHRLDSLYKEFPELMKLLNIEKICEVYKDCNVWQYDFEIKGHNNPIMIKNVEAIRYGPFAKHQDLGRICVDDEIISKMLTKIMNFVDKKFEETANFIAREKSE